MQTTNKRHDQSKPANVMHTCAHAGAGSRASSRVSSNSGRHSSQVQADFRIMQELLRRDYAVGYIMLSWLLRCTWAVTPAIALLLKLPEPVMARATRQQVPALLAWLLFGGDKIHSAEQQQQVLQQLSPAAIKGLQEQLVGPTAALASMASFAKTYQMLASAPATAQQVRSVCLQLVNVPWPGSM